MYLERFWTDNLMLGENVSGNCCQEDGAVRRWSLLTEAAPSKNTLLLKLIAVCLGGGKYLSSVLDEVHGCIADASRVALFGVSLRRERPQYVSRKTRGMRPGMSPIQLEFSPDGEVRVSAAGLRARCGATNVRRPFSDLDAPGEKFVYGYASHRGRRRHAAPDPEFTPRSRSTRFETFFEQAPELSPVDEWLYRQYRNASRYNSKQAEEIFNVALAAVTGWFPELSFSHWDDEKICFRRRGVTCSLSDLDSHQVRRIEFLVDFVRQAADSRTVKSGFCLTNGMLLLDNVETLFAGCKPANAIRVLTDLFPNMQYIVSCHDQGLVRRIRRLSGATVPASSSVPTIPPFVATKTSRTKSKLIRQHKNAFLSARFQRRPRAPKNCVVLVDVDSSIPNLALMKLSRHYRDAGKEVIVTRDSSPFRDSRHVFASCVCGVPVQQRVLHWRSLPRRGRCSPRPLSQCREPWIKPAGRR